MEAEDYYAISILENGRVSASGAVGKKLPSFDKIDDAQERINLTDAYLRDGIKENDNSVLPVLNGVLEDESVNEISRVHAHLQLFIYYLFSNDHSAALALASKIKSSPLLKDAKVKNTEIAGVAMNDLEPILLLAAALATGKTDDLARYKPIKK